jgi:prepilin-type N-terminal cleavage/methylation domain-containing protein
MANWSAPPPGRSWRRGAVFFCRLGSTNSRKWLRAPGFTLIELLVVIAIIGVLAGMLFPVFARARESGRRSACISNLHQLTLALKSYTSDWNETNTRMYYTSTYHWMAAVQPYIKNYRIYRCPTAPDIVDGYSGLNLGYGMNCFNFKDGCGSFWYGPADVAVRDTIGTIWLADCCPSIGGKGCYWVGSGSVFVEPVPYVDYRHNEGFCAVFYDGHAEWLKKTYKWQWSINPDD